MIGIFGGSFDPPHLGHLFIIQNFWEKYNSKLYIVPNYISPFKVKKGAEPKNILDMLFILIEEFSLKDIEIYEEELKRGGVSYTFQTILEFKERFPLEEISLLIGEDNLEGLPKWKNIDLILENAKILVYLRNGSSTAKIPDSLSIYKNNIYIQENSLHPASSSEFRKLKNENLVSPQILEYIKLNSLYEYTSH
ncbi:MAG: nicotinate (nicotinamide) nucleotide adenylyltransferase [Spirochaetia bacterium]|nr:nicotinate (nicotinamide) nucleotide adenylyltransferase [Spirochaetia bacterium]